MNSRSSLAVIVGVMAVLGWADRASARRGGPPSGVTGSVASLGNTCTVCHANATGGTGSVQILGAPAVYAFSTNYDLTVRIQDAARVGAGFQLSAEDPEGNPLGGFVVIDAVNTQLNINDSSYINHTGDGVDNSVTNWASLGNAAEYQVRWVSPSSWSGPVTFWAAGNAINNNFASSGDHVYVTSVSAQPVPAVSEWGLLVLGLLLATAATVITARRTVRSA